MKSLIKLIQKTWNEILMLEAQKECAVEFKQPNWEVISDWAQDEAIQKMLNLENELEIKQSKNN